MGNKKNKKMLDKTKPRIKLLPETPQLTEITNAVLDNPVLMDKIVKYSVYSFDGKQINQKVIRKIRLVNKSWLQSASRVLKFFHDAVINMVIGLENGESSRNGEFYNKVKENGKFYEERKGNMLDKFVLVFSKATRLFDSIIPIDLEIGQYYFSEEHSENLSNFFEQCSDMISKFCVKFTFNGGSKNLNLNHINFPFLRTLVFKFIPWTKPGESLMGGLEIYGSNANGLTILQDILTNSANLHELALEGYVSNINSDDLSLPPTIKIFDLRHRLTDKNLTLITNNKLPNLNTFNLEIDAQFDGEREMSLIYIILEHFRQQLTNLSVNIKECSWKRPVRIKFPLMEKLKSLKLSGLKYDLVPELKQVWQKFVPNLTQIIFENLGISPFLELVQGLPYENVDELNLSLAGFFCNNDTQPLSAIVPVFPNIHKLTLKFFFSDISSLKYLFQNLTHLKILNLSFVKSKFGSTPGHQIVSVFLGITLELAEALVNYRRPKVDIAIDNPESIMNLTELNSLTLLSPPLHLKGKDYSKIISTRGLEKMPKLQKIILLGGFGGIRQCS